jgi:quinol monooxygenase YgiN
MELCIIARFHAREGQQEAVAAAIADVAGPTKAEPGCLTYGAYRSTRDPQLFFIYSRWIDEAAFNAHAELPHTRRFLARVEPLITHALDVTRTAPIA